MRKGPSLQKLTMEETVAEFFAILQVWLGHRTAPSIDQMHADTSEDAEALRFRAAEQLLRAACPGPAHCSEQRCRRGGLCRHLADLYARQGRHSPQLTRRTPGADAVRHAIWVYMNSLVARTR
jgi:hypothetical protein